MFRVVFSAALILGLAPSALAVDVGLVDAVAGETADHTDEVALRVLRTGDGYTLVTSCSGCLLDVRAEDWIEADNPRRRAPRNDLIFEIAVAAERAPTDEAVFALLLEQRSGVFAFDVVALLESTTGRLVERHVTVFARSTPGGYEPIDWQTWACESGKVRCEADADGAITVHFLPPVSSSSGGVQ